MIPKIWYALGVLAWIFACFLCYERWAGNGTLFGYAFLPARIVLFAGIGLVCFTFSELLQNTRES